MARDSAVAYVVCVRVRWGSPWLLTVADAVLAIAVAVIQLAGTVRFYGSDARSLDAFGVTLLVGTAAALAFRRRAPIPTLLTVTTLTVTYNALDYSGPWWTIAIVIALFKAVAVGRRTVSAAIIGVASIALFATGLVFGQGHFADPSGMLWYIGWVTASFVTGEVVRARWSYSQEVERHAAEAERTRAQEALRRASEERMRIARELHDVVAHSISIINVQAGVALHLLERQPEAARPALEVIRQTSHDALRELRATLDVLRSVDDADPRAPVPTLARLDDLAATAAAAGVDLTVRVSGEARSVPRDVDLAAYRIAQESITNVARHARPPTATLAIDYRPDEIVVEVADAGNQSALPSRDGHGLIGMRERAASVGGRLEAGPKGEGGFRVRASLPLRDRA